MIDGDRFGRLRGHYFFPRVQIPPLHALGDMLYVGAPCLSGADLDAIRSDAVPDSCLYFKKKSNLFRFSPADVSNFDDAFTSQQVKDTPVDPHFVSLDLGLIWTEFRVVLTVSLPAAPRLVRRWCPAGDYIMSIIGPRKPHDYRVE